MLLFQSRTNVTNDSPNDSYAHKDYSDLKDLTPRSPYLPSSPILKFDNSPRPSSIASSTLDDVLLPGDIVSEGGHLQGETIRRVSLGTSPRASLDSAADLKPATEFQVVRRLGTGSYAVVYLVREVLSRPLSSPSSEDGGAVLGPMDLDTSPTHSRHNSIVYGREYAIKCLSKANLDEEQLSAQMTEVKIHQGLRSHPNIVSLHRTLETSSYLLLLLEFVPGEDLFYFLEQARDHHDSYSPSEDESVSSVASNTPPTPGLLSTLVPSRLLSRTRLRLVASMFAQMCDAVAASHSQQVYHRDIKPENFIVTDGYVEQSDGTRERKVLVKLTDFGLSTKEIESNDMDCGSAPYMSYECRNNVAPSYRTDAADVWSLGIVLINMLYHHNPWTDTAQGACSSFNLFRSSPVQFFMSRFGGMTRPVAEFLANKVFCILEDGDAPTGAVRVSAAEFGSWAHDLADLLAPPPVNTPAFTKRHQRVVSTASSIDHPVSIQSQVSHRPCSRNPSGSTPVTRTPAITSRSLSRAPSVVGLTYDRSELSELSTVIDQVEESVEHLPLHGQSCSQDVEMAEPVSREDSPSPSRSASANRRRKRGARKGRGASTASVSTPVTPKDETLDMLAKASESLAREISRQSRPPSTKSATRPSSVRSGSSTGRSNRSNPEPPAMFPMPVALFSSNPMAPPPLPALTTSVPMVRPDMPPRSPSSATTASKKPSKWKLSIGKSKGSSVQQQQSEEPAPPSPTTPPSAFAIRGGETPMSVQASQVTSLLMGLNAPPNPAAVKAAANDGAATRGRRNRGSPGPELRGPSSRSPAGSQSRSRGRHTGSSALGVTDVPVPPLPANAQSLFSSPNHSSDWTAFSQQRGRSPQSTRNGAAPSSSSSSSSHNWRSSMSTTSSAVTSTSNLTRYSNASSRSVSTAATSVSGQSWRVKDNASISSASTNNSRYHPNHPNIPRNIKIMNGIPNELVQVPRGQHPSLDSDVYAPRKQRSRKLKDAPLGTITERPGQLSPDARSPGQKSPASPRSEDGSISPTDMAGDGKAQKGQINALAKMLSALRR